MSEQNNLDTNTFQIYNYYVDKLLAYLTADEWKVLTCLIRLDAISSLEALYNITGLLGSDKVLEILASLKSFGLITEQWDNDKAQTIYCIQPRISKIDIERLKARKSKTRG